MSQSQAEELTRQEMDVATRELDVRVLCDALTQESTAAAASVEALRQACKSSTLTSEQASSILQGVKGRQIALPDFEGTYQQVAKVRRDAVQYRIKATQVLEQAAQQVRDQLKVLKDELHKAKQRLADEESKALDARLLAQKQEEERLMKQRLEQSRVAAPAASALDSAPVVTPLVASKASDFDNERSQPHALSAGSLAAAFQKPLPDSAGQPAPIPLHAGPSEVARRNAPRVRLQAAVDMTSDSNFYTGFSTNISDGGLFVATVSLLPIGTEIDVAFSLPGHGKIQSKGTVRWVRDVQSTGADSFPGMGIQLEALDDGSKTAIRAFVSTREPIFFPG